MRSILGLGLFVLVVLLLVIQAVPYGRDHTNPPVLDEPNWDSPQTRALAKRACFDCHSNETTWPWYSNVAPVSWFIQRDVDLGRGKVNFSEAGRGEKEAKESAKTVREGGMPPWYYVPLHPEANLSPADRDALIQGLEATFGPGG